MTTRGLHEQQLQKMQTQPGFIAALDQFITASTRAP